MGKSAAADQADPQNRGVDESRPAPLDCREARELSFSDVQSLLSSAIQRRGYYCWVREVWDCFFIYSESPQGDSSASSGEGSKLFKQTYTIDADEMTVTLGEKKTEVTMRMIYEPVGQQTETSRPAAPLGRLELREIVDLSEKGMAKDGTIRIKVISPGHGSSGYYPEATLKRDGPRVFRKGLHMYANHPTAREASERPERDIRELMGTLTEDAEWQDNAKHGPGLYARASVLQPWRPFVEQASPHIGVSIRAWGQGKPGEVDGQKTKIIERIDDAASVDFVTRAGAGGKVLDLMESIRASLAPPGSSDETNAAQNRESEENRMAEEKALTELRESYATLQGKYEKLSTDFERLHEREILRDNAQRVSALVEKHGRALPQMTRNRLIKTLTINPPLTEKGELDGTKLEEVVKAEVAEAAAEVAAITGAGRVSGNGAAAADPDGGSSIDEKKLDEVILSNFASMGLNETTAKIAAAGRVQ